MTARKPESSPERWRGLRALGLALAIAGGLAFVIGHLVYRAKNPPKAAKAPDVGDVGDAGKDIPEKVVRHSLAARLFHWVMAVTMITLLVTAFFPILGIQFNWVPIHWMAGIVLTAAIIFHIIHASFWLNLRNIWISRKDWAEWKQEMEHALGKGEEVSRHSHPNVGNVTVDGPTRHGCRRSG